MQKTTLGLTRLAPGEGLSTDNYSFQDLNPKIINTLLEDAAFRHRHDAHAALSSPLEPPIVALAAVGGTIPSDTAIWVGYTLIDDDGGETTLNSDPVTITTQAGLVTPEDAPTVEVLHDAGSLVAANYSYALTITDGLGGQTAIGPVVTVAVPTGFANSRIEITDFDALVTASGGTGYRLWRRVNGGAWGLVADGVADTISDDGTLCVDCTVSPPLRTGRTNATNVLKVTVPVIAPNDSAAQFNVYATLDGTFSNPSLLGTYPVIELGVEKSYTSLDFLDGAPPESSLSLPGAPKINADLEVINLHVKAPVESSTSLPTSGNLDGDLRVTLDDYVLHVWNANGAGWQEIAGGGGGSAGHTILDADAVDAEMVARPKLSFGGPNVTVTDDAVYGVTRVDVSAPLALPSREDVAVVGFVGAVADDTVTRDVAMPKGYRLLKLVTGLDIRVQVYTSDATRTADAGRTSDTPPAGSAHGVIVDAEAVATEAITFTPAIEGWNDDLPVVDVGYIRLTALAAGDGDVTLTLVRTEA